MAIGGAPIVAFAELKLTQANSYPVARAASGRIRRHFAAQSTAHQGVAELAPLPDEAAIEAMVDSAFWASLRPHEGHPLKVTLAFLPPEQKRAPLTFGQLFPLNADVVTRLAPAVERPGVHLGVWRGVNGELHVWGATRRLPPLCFVLEAIAPGLLVIKHRRMQESRKFVNVAVLEGDRIKVLNPQGVGLTDAPAMVASLFGAESPAALADSTNVLIQLAVSMRAHARGGALLVAPDGSERWRESMAVPVPYAVQPAYTELSDLISGEPAERQSPRWQDGLRRAVDVVAGLTAVDGAMVLTDRCVLLGFGAKIGRREGFARVDRVIDTEPVEGSTPHAVHPGDLGGTRHLSGAQFAHDQRDSLALVASQDGRFTVFAWSAAADAVLAYRVEALLL